MAPPSDDDWYAAIEGSLALSKKSKKSYWKHARALLRACTGPGTSTLSDILFNFDRAYRRISHLSPSVLRNHLVVILALFKRGEERHFFKRSDASIVKHHRAWMDAHVSCHKLHMNKMDDNLPTHREIEGRATVSDFKNAHVFMAKTEGDTQETLLVAFHALIMPPLRGGDLSHVRIGKQLEGNCVFIDSNGIGRLLIRDHKTASSYQALERVVPIPALQFLEDSLEAQPREWLFTTKKLNGPYSDGGFSDWKSRVFRKAFNGRPVTSNSLRHSYISEMWNKSSINDARRLATTMGHSLGMQRQYVRLQPPSTSR
jgi:hypothetical protein